MSGVLLIDGHNLFLRNYCVSPHLDANGERVGGSIGTIRSIKKLLVDFRPTNLLVVWDGEGGSQRRKAIYGNYKSGRTVRLNQKPEHDFGTSPEQQLENVRRQRQLAVDYLALLGIPQVRPEGVEADDVIAYLANELQHPDNLCTVVTTDKDMLQLIRSRESGDCEVRVLSPVKGILYDRQTFISEQSVLPENFRIVKALAGDKSDNIPGIKGFGERTIAKLFPFLSERRSTADQVLEAAKSLAGKLGGRLIDEKARFLENLKLVDLSSPMLSATAARQARDALAKDVGCRELELRMRMTRDGVTITDAHFIEPFKQFVIRRRRFLSNEGERNKSEPASDV